MRICPECGKLVSYNSYFGSYICSNCEWHDDEPNKIRMEKYRNLCNYGRYETNSKVRDKSEKSELALA